MLAQEKQQRVLASSAKAPIWNIPYRRNLFFTGREDLLQELHDNFTKNKTTTPAQAICGLGGIGKTQTAIEYAYRYRDEYTVVLWVTADERLVSDFVALASLLGLPERNASKQSLALNAVKRWLEQHTNWLLIFDNVEDLGLVGQFIPAIK